MKLLIKDIFERKEKNNASWLVGARIIKAIFSLIVSVITARYLGPGNYGIIGYATTVIAFFTVISVLGFDAVIIKFLFDSPEKEGETIGTSILFRGAASLISILLVFIFVSLIDKGDETTIKIVFLCSLGILFQIFYNLSYWFQSRYNSKIVAISTLIAYITISIYKILLYVFHKSVYWFALSTSIDHIVLSICLIIFYKKYGGPKPSFSFSKGISMLKSSYHYILSGLMIVIYGQTDRIMLKHMLGETEVGFYTLAVQICSMWVFVLSAVIDSMYPTIIKLHEKDNEKFEEKNRVLFAIVFYMSISVSLIFQVIAKPGITTVYGNDYLQAVTPLKIVTWYTAFAYLGVARNAWLVCKNRQKYLKYMYIIAIVANIIMNYFFIPSWGASGAAIATLITQILTCFILPLFFKEMRQNVILMIQAIYLKDLFRARI